MSRLIVQSAPFEHLGWIVARSGCILTADFQAIEAVDSRGSVRGMVGFEKWSPNSVLAHMAVVSPMAWRQLLPAAFYYAFEQHGLGLMLGATPGDNAKALEFLKSIGFRETYRIRDGHRPGVDTVLSEMRREECRWLGGANGFRRAA